MPVSVSTMMDALRRVNASTASLVLAVRISVSVQHVWSLTSRAFGESSGMSVQGDAFRGSIVEAAVTALSAASAPEVHIVTR